MGLIKTLVSRRGWGGIDGVGSQSSMTGCELLDRVVAGVDFFC